MTVTYRLPRSSDTPMSDKGLQDNAGKSGIRHQLPIAIGASLVLLLFSSQPLLASEARMWLEKMSQAVRTLNYSGTFIHSHQGKLETMEIVHAVDSHGAERERLLSLNGEAREVLRDNDYLTCIWSGNRTVVKGRRGVERSALPTWLPSDTADLHTLYDIELIGKDRIAGYPTVLLMVHPHDHMRYGYRLWLEETTGMLLRSDVVDKQGKPLEQMMFTDIVMQSPVSDDMLKPTISHEGFQQIMDGMTYSAAEPVEELAGWSFEGMPQGFVVTYKERKQMPVKHNKVVHLLLSDGVATVSVYIEKVAANQKMLLDGLSSIGGVNAYGRKVAGHQITVIGEVPEVTVRQIASAISYQSR